MTPTQTPQVGPQAAPAQGVPVTQTVPPPEQPAISARPDMSGLLESIIDQDVAQQAGRFRYAEEFAKSAAASQYFAGANSQSQATMKIMAGYELGLPPIVSLMHINLIKGKVSLDGNLIASLLRKHGYDWGFLKHDNDGCELAFSLRGSPLIDPATGKQVVVSFLRKDAEAAELAAPRGEKKEKGMYDKYPRNMCFNRCITNFQKWFAPEVSNGIALYAPGELETTDAKPGGPQMPQRATEQVGSVQETETQEVK